MKKAIIILAAIAMSMVCPAQESVANETGSVLPTVYVTRDLSPESLVRIYQALGRKATGRVALKISTGESEKTGYIRPAMLKPLIDSLNAQDESTHVTIVESNTAYPGRRMFSFLHWREIEKRGFQAVAPVDILDEEGSMRIPVQDSTHIAYDLVGDHLRNYDYMINLAHFKGHQMAGMGGVLKNSSIGVASSTGKAYIHSSGATESKLLMWLHAKNQDGFTESMAAAAQAVHDYFGHGERILYISVMYRMSIDCDCNGNPHEPLVADYGILASLDPVALDQACYDIVTQIHHDEHNDPTPLLERIASRRGTHIMEWGEKIGLGKTQYVLVPIDESCR